MSTPEHTPLDLELHPAADVERWRREGWWTGETFAAFVASRSERFAERTAVIGLRAADRADHQRRKTAEYVQLSYARQWEVSAAVAAALAAAGVRAGDRVVLNLPNTVEFPVGVMALMRMGAVPVFALYGSREPVVARLTAAAGAAAVLVAADPRPLDPEVLDAECAERGVAAPELVDAGCWESEPAGPVPPVAEPDPAAAGLLQLSGGTTGESKLIPRTHDGYLLSVRRSAEICALDGNSVLMVTLPASHNFPMSSPGILGAWDAGSAVVMAPDPSPATAFRLIAEHSVTHLSLVPPLARAWIEAARGRGTRPESVRVVGIGGARLAEAVAREVEPVLGGRLQQVFGMAEGLVNYTRLDDPDEVVLGTQGRPLCEADEIRVVDDDGRPVATDVEGELQTRGPYTITRYLGDSARERSSFTDDGYYVTGDLVRVRADNNIVVTGRTGDRINRAGEKIPASGVEEEVLDHPDVVDAVAVGLPDDRLGEALVLAVTLRGEATAPDLRAHLRAKGLPTHWLPDRTVVLDAMPTTGVGKNSRRDLRAEVLTALTDRSNS